MTKKLHFPFTIAPKAREKLNSLSIKGRGRMLSQIRHILQEKAFVQQIQELQLAKKKIILRLPYWGEKRLIASLVTNSEHGQLLRILDFLAEDQMEKGHFSTDGTDYTIIYLDDQNLETIIDTHIDEFTKTDINKDLFWTREPVLITAADFEVRDDDFWVYVIDENSQQDPDLLLSSEQYEIGLTDLPILLTGSPGSGKTTVAVYRAVYESYHHPEQEIVYFTSSAALKVYVENIAARVDEEKLDNLKFFDYISFCLELGKNYGWQLKAVQQVTKQKFIDKFCKPRQINYLDSLYLWQEIRHLLKGFGEKNNGVITAAEYEELVAESVLPPGSNYGEIYTLALAYQNWLQGQGYWDEIDLTRYLLGKISADFPGVYDILFCDDVLALTELEIKLLLKLLRKNKLKLPKCFLSGTPEKIIQPIGLSWEKVKGILAAGYPDLPRSVIEGKELKTNFRSVSTILQLGEDILTFTNDNYPDKTTKVTERHSLVVSYDKPLIIFGNEGKILKGKKRLGDRRAIVVTNEEEKQRLTSIFHDQGVRGERILLITEIQGLEFDQVLAWKLLTDFEKLLPKESPIKYDPERLKYELVYACTTIARKKLYFYEKRFSDFWYRAEIDLLVSEGRVTAVESFFIEAEETREALLATAAEYESRGAWKFARENYLRVGETTQATINEARLEEGKGNWEAAGDIWDSLSIWDEAYRCWEEVEEKLWQKKWASLTEESWQKRAEYWEEEKNYQLSLYCYEKADDVAGKIRCLVATQQWELLGDEFGRLGDEEKAEEYYLLASKYYVENNEGYLAAQMWIRLEQWEQAALLWHDLEGWDSGQQNVQQLLGKIEQAAIYYEGAKLWLPAEKCWRKLNNWERVALACEYQHKWLDAGMIWENLGAKEKAGVCYEKAQDWGKAELCWRELNYWGCVAIACEAQNKWHDAAVAWKQTEPLEKAALCYERGNLWGDAEECWHSLQNWERVALVCEYQEKWQDAARNWEKIAAWERGAYGWLRVAELANAAECYEKGNLWAEAEECWRQLSRWERVAIACEAQNKWSDAANIWETIELWQQAAQAWQQIDERENAAICYEKALAWAEAEICWRQLVNWDGVAHVCERQGKWENAAVAWQEVTKIDRAARCYEKASLWARAEECWREVSNWEGVASVCERQAKWEAAAVAWQEIEQREKAAICYEKASLWARAEECWRRVSNWEKVADVCERQGKWEAAAFVWQEIKQIERAAICYEKASLWARAEECWRRVSNWEKVAYVCEYQGKWLEGAQIWEKLAQWQLAGKAWEQIEQTEKAAKCYEKGELWFEAEECWRKLGNWERIGITCERQERYSGAAQAWKLAGNLEKAARFYEREKLWGEAEECWHSLQNWEQVAICCEHQNRYSAAGEAWKLAKNFEQAARCYEKGEFWPQGEECWRSLQNWEQVAICCEHQHRWEVAAQAWKQAGKLHEVARCYERDGLWSQAEAYWHCLEEWERVAIACEHQQKWEAAAEAYLKMGGTKHYKAANIYRKLGKWQKAALVFSQQMIKII